MTPGRRCDNRARIAAQHSAGRPGRSRRAGVLAVVAGRVRCGAGVAVGPLAVLRGPLHLGAGSVVAGPAVLEGTAVFGSDTRVHPFAVLGGPPQDRTYDGAPPRHVRGAGHG
jgi:UDP-N-acetylglucosamine acyltransferase